MMPSSLVKLVVKGGDAIGRLAEDTNYDISSLSAVFNIDKKLGCYDLTTPRPFNIIYDITLCRKQVVPVDHELEQVWQGEGSQYVWAHNAATMSYKDGVLVLGEAHRLNPNYAINALVEFHKKNPKAVVRVLDIKDCALGGREIAILQQFMIDHRVEELSVLAEMNSTRDEIKQFALSLPNSVRKVTLSRQGLSFHSLGSLRECSSVVSELENVFECEAVKGNFHYGIWSLKSSFSEEKATELSSLILTRRAVMAVPFPVAAEDVYQYSRPSDDLQVQRQGELLTLSPMGIVHEYAVPDALMRMLEENTASGLSGINLKRMKVTKQDLDALSQFAKLSPTLSYIELFPSNGMSLTDLAAFASSLPPSVKQIKINGGIEYGASMCLWRGEEAKLDNYDLSSLNAHFVVNKSEMLRFDSIGDLEPSGIIGNVTLARKNGVGGSKL